MSVLENGHSLPTDWTFGSGRNRVNVERFGWVVGLRSGLDNPIWGYHVPEEETRQRRGGDETKDSKAIQVGRMV